ncbi:MAG: hypothetical protein JRI33_04870 [Deltaproteobacteria bacterium]|nr:hypothetical protein [Deltaproteobacteria bacterium]
MHWHFEEYPPNLVEAEVTQQEQFQNEEIDLPATLIRETIQNSLDARINENGRAIVSFRYVSGNLPEPWFLRSLFERHLEHASAACINISDCDFERPTALIIEDFGTTGLTGAWDTRIAGNFHNFWRRQGITDKSGKQQGRRGLGKLVFSASSRLRAFFGLTIPNDPNVPLLMGQTVLRFRLINGRLYPPHAFFSGVKQTDPEKGLPIPITDLSLINDFRKQFGLRRTNELGLSIVVPFPEPSLKLSAMMTAGITSFFIPILHEQLVLEFGDITVDAGNIFDVARKQCNGKISDIDELFAFIMETREKMRDAVSPEPGWHRNGRLTKDSFRHDDLEKMKADFAASRMVAACMPVRISRKSGERRESNFFLFLKKPVNLSKGQDFYVRSGLNIPGESKFRDRRALGMLLAEDEPVAEFLGDAENPAHYRWNGKSPELHRKYKNPEMTLRAIRNSLIGLHDLLTQVAEEADELALRDFFWIPGRPGGKGKKKGTPEPPAPPIPKQDKYRIEKVSGGFTVRPSTTLSPEELPVQLVIMVAYDTVSGNPFRLYSEYDFDFSRQGDLKIKVAGADVLAEKNTITCTVKDPDFRIHVSGFDLKRDLVIRMEE